MTTTKIVSFIQGMGYPVIMVVLAYIIENLGTSGIVPIGVATVITGVLRVIENNIQKETGRALMGAAPKAD